MVGKRKAEEGSVEPESKKVHFEDSVVANATVIEESKEEDEYDPAPAPASASAITTSTITFDPIVVESTPAVFEETKNYKYSEWQELLPKIAKEGNEEKIKNAFEKYLLQYVNDGEHWSMYIETLINNKTIESLDKPKIEGLFSKILTKIYNVKLWRLYLKYVELINPITPDNSDKARSIVLKAYNFAIETVGIDFFHSNELWEDYLKYLYVWQTVSPNEVSTRESLIRKALKKMISYPSLNLEDNWKVFVKFEDDINLNKSRKSINESTEEYMKLKEFNDELIKLTKSIKKIKERKYSLRQIKRWNSWIIWERENKMKLNEEEVNKRINYVYNLSIQYCPLIPELWFNYSNYILFERQKSQLGLEILNNGIKVNPFTLILRYQISNYYENENVIDIEKIKNIWIELIQKIEENDMKNKDKLITYCYSTLMRTVKRIGSMKEVRVVFKLARQYKGIKWEIFQQYAMIEYYNNEIKIASRTFSLGMQYFNKDIEFIMNYLDFVISIKDMITFKSVIEISINENFKEEKEELKILFGKYFEVEQEFGDIKSINKLNERYMQVFGKTTPIELIYKNDEKFNGIKELDEYKSGNSDEGSGNGEMDDDIEITKEKSNNDIISVIDELNDNTRMDDVDGNNTSSGSNEDVMTKLYSFLQALPQDSGFQEQVKNLSIGQILEYFQSVGS